MMKLKELHKSVNRINGWRVMPGMREDDGSLVVSADDRGYITTSGGVHSRSYRDTTDCLDCHTLPLEHFEADLTDPATLGCLLHLVREAWGAPTVFVSYDDASLKWRWDTVHGGSKEGWDTEAEALVEALRAAPSSGAAWGRST